MRSSRSTNSVQTGGRSGSKHKLRFQSFQAVGVLPYDRLPCPDKTSDYCPRRRLRLLEPPGNPSWCVEAFWSVRAFRDHCFNYSHQIGPECGVFGGAVMPIELFGLNDRCRFGLIYISLHGDSLQVSRAPSQSNHTLPSTRHPPIGACSGWPHPLTDRQHLDLPGYRKHFRPII